MDREQPTPVAREKPRPIDWIRWGLIAAIVLFGFLGSLTDSFKTCSDEDVNGKVVELCERPGPTEIGFLSALALIVLLALPDISEASITGIGSFKRRLRQTEQQVTDQTRRADNLETQLALVSATVQNAVAVGVGNQQSVILALPGDFEHLVAEVRGKAPAGSADSPVSQPAQSTSPAEDAIRLINLWEELAESLAIGPYAPRDRRDTAGWERTDQIRFLDLFREEIELVRATRNSVAHGRDVPADVVRSAADAADELLRIWRTTPDTT